MAVDPVRAEEGLRELLALYRAAQRIIATEIREAIRDERIAQQAFRREAYRRVEAELQRLGVESDPVARRLIGNAWAEGDRSVLDALPSGSGTFSFSEINRGALAEMQAALVDTLDGARRTVGRQVYDQYRRAGLRSVSLGLIGARGSSRAVAQDLRARLAQKQITAFVDKAGRSWDMRRYTEMVARTTTREAVVQAQIQRMAEQGIEYARVSTSSNPCPICSEWQGVLVTIAGRGGGLAGEPATSLDSLPNGGPPFHPQCRHFLEPEGLDFADFAESSAQHDRRSSAGGSDVQVRNAQGWAPPTAAQRKFVDDGLANIESVHKPKLEINVSGKAARGEEAYYRPHGRQLNISGPTVDPTTIAHEIGHAIDDQIFGGGTARRKFVRGKAKEPTFRDGVENPALQPLWDAIVDAGTERRLRSQRSAGSFRRYMLQPSEVFARSYEQWIALRGPSAEMKQYVRDVLDGKIQGTPPEWFWADQDFERIADELDQLFGVK